MEVDEVDCVGLATDFCVKFTAEDALNEGFKTNILWDLTRAVDSSKDNIDELKLSFTLLQSAHNLGY